MFTQNQLTNLVVFSIATVALVGCGLLQYTLSQSE